MLLFHVNRDRKLIKEFVPRLPVTSITAEEPNIERICVSTSIEGCFSAVIFGGHELKESMYLNRLYDDGYIEKDIKEYVKFKLYIFDSNGMCKENILSYETLHERNLVADCLITKECWILNQNIVPKEILEIEVHSSDLEYSNYLRRNGESRRLAHNTNIKGRVVSCLSNNNNGDFAESYAHISSGIIRFDDYFQTHSV